MNPKFIHPCKFHSRIISILQTFTAYQHPRLSIFEPGIRVIGCRLWGHPTEVASATMILNHML